MSGPPTDAALVALATDAARAAGDLLAERFGGPARGVESKSSRTDLVSDADRDAEALILDMIAAGRPGDAIVAEEGGGADGVGDAALRWVIDPLDGTTNFLWGIPHWSVSIAVSDAEGPRVGVVHDPTRGETFTAVRGAGADLGGRPLWLDDAPALAEALVGTGFNYRADERARQGARAAAVLPAVRDIRRFGSAALDLAWLAAGRMDAYYESGLNEWDWAAGRLLVTEAGGTVGELPSGADGGLPCVVAARAPLYAPLLALLGS